MDGHMLARVFLVSVPFVVFCFIELNCDSWWQREAALDLVQHLRGTGTG